MARRSGRGEGSGPAHAGMLGASVARPRTRRLEGNRSGWVHSLRAAPPSGRRLRLRASSGTPAHGPPAVPAVLRARCRRSGDGHSPQLHAPEAPRPGPAPASRRGGAPRRGRHPAVQWGDRADRSLVGRRERQAGHLELDLQPRSARPRAGGFCQSGERGSRRRRRCLRQHDGPRRPGAGVPHGLLPGSWGPSPPSDRLRGGAGPTRSCCDARRGYRLVPVVAHLEPQHREGLASRAATC